MEFLPAFALKEDKKKFKNICLTSIHLEHGYTTVGNSSQFWTLLFVELSLSTVGQFTF